MKYLFLLGCHRSGTSMLQQALNRHGGIVIPPETKYFSSFLGHSRKCQLRRLIRINTDLQIVIPPPPETIRGTVKSRQFYGEMVERYLAKLRRENVTYFGEKTPAHAGYLPRIKQLFPDAKFLWLFRDGRDVALSMRKVPWMSRNLAVNMAVWLFYYRKQMRAMQERNQDLLVIKYEDLVTQPMTEFTRICTFLDVPFELAMVNGYGNREGILAWEYPWKRLALEQITCERVGVWRKELSSKEVEMLEWLGGRSLRSLGYPLETTPSWWNVRHYPGLVQGVIRLFGRLPLDETANQLFGRAICFGG